MVGTHAVWWIFWISVFAVMSSLAATSKLLLRRLGIDSYQEPVLYLHRDCQLNHSEGFEAQSRVELSLKCGSPVRPPRDVAQADGAVVRLAGQAFARPDRRGCGDRPASGRA